MKSIILNCLCVIGCCLTSRAELGPVKVEGNHFVGNDGATLIFRGLATSDPDKLARNHQWNEHYFEMARSWGANIVRLPVHPAAWRDRGSEAYLQLLDQGVAWAGKHGMYVIIDWHSIGNLPGQKFLPGSSGLYPPRLYDTTREETLDFWITMARHYASNNTVAFFELFNEPATGGKLGDCTWAEWKQFMEKVIAAIRTHNGTAIPLVAGFDYGYDLTPVASDPINAKGIGYVSHPYPMKARPPWKTNWTHDWGFVARKYPVFLTEFGYVGADNKKAYNPIIGDEAYGQALTSYCDEHGISFTVWCFDPNWEPTLIEDWSFTPTREGTFFKKVLQQKGNAPER